MSWWGVGAADVELAQTDKITYSVDQEPPYAPGQSVVVTATLEGTGVAWPDRLPEGWTETSIDDGDVDGDVRRCGVYSGGSGGSGGDPGDV